MEGTAEVGATDPGVGKRGRGCLNLGKDLLDSGTCSFSTWVRDVGGDTKYWEGFGSIPPQGGPQYDGTSTAEVDL